MAWDCATSPSGWPRFTPARRRFFLNTEPAAAAASRCCCLALIRMRTGKNMMKSLIIDDEPSARARLARMLAAHPAAVSVIGEARDGLDALEKISDLRPDLVFMDVEMPGLNGIQVLQAMPESARPPLVIFTTGYDQHALAAFEANAVAYLLKPIEAERLAQAIDRAWRIHSFQEQRGVERGNLSSFIKNISSHLSQLVGRKRDRFFLL